MKATWEVINGYAGKTWHTTRIDIDELAAECETADQAEETISVYIQGDFEQKVSWNCQNLSEIVAAVMARRKEMEAEGI